MRFPELIDVPAEVFSERLLIREPRPGDGTLVFQAVEASRKDLKEWLPWVDSADSPDSCELSVRRAYALFATREDLRYHIFLRETGTYIGGTGLHRIQWAVPKFEIGYWIDSRYVRQGYATEAAREALRLTWSLSTDRVISIVHEENVASIAVTNKLGGTLVGTHAGPLLLFEYTRPVAIPKTEV